MKTVLVTGIGGSIGVDVARSLRRAGGYRVIGVDANPWGLAQTRSIVDRSVLLPRADRDGHGFVAALERVIGEEAVDFAFVNPDPELEVFAELMPALPVPTSLPPVGLIGTCLDKGETAARVADRDLLPGTRDVDSRSDVEEALRDFGAPLWLRAAVGPGGRGSLPVDTADEAVAWMEYWNRRGKGYRWVAHEFLPGKNINWTGIFVAGELVASAAMERLSYFLADAAASGVSGQVARCATVDPRPYEDVGQRVVRALGEPHGVYSVDLRHDRSDWPKVTEINPRLAGRPWLYTNAGANIPAAAVLALTGGDPGAALEPGGLRIGVHLYRQLDLEPVVGTPEEIEG